MSKTIGQIKEELNSKIPREAVTQRDSGFGAKLSYLTSYYVFDRLNQIFGPENWSYTIKELKCVYEGKVNDKFYVSYTAQVTLQTKFPGQPEYEQRIDTDIGFGDGQDKNNPGKPHELAVKEAVTDGLKRCAKSLGMSMGLALYDKSQENVEDEAPKAPNKEPKPTVSGTPHVAVVPAALPGKPAIGSNKAAQDAASYKKVIISAASALEAKGVITKAEFKKKHITDAFKVEKLDDLKEADIVKLYKEVQSTYKELQLQ